LHSGTSLPPNAQKARWRAQDLSEGGRAKGGPATKRVAARSGLLRRRRPLAPGDHDLAPAEEACVQRECTRAEQHEGRRYDGQQDTRQPTNRDFLQGNQKDPWHPSVQRYNSWYRFDMHEHSAGNGGTEGNVCHYHYYTLQVFSQILADIKKEPYASDPDFAALYNKLLYNWAGGAAARCDDSGLPASKKSMRGHPLAEL
jgi:hypothetical protein